MRASQLFVIYLAAAAPFGVAFLLRRHALCVPRASLYARAAWVALVWPAWLLRLALRAAGAGRGRDIQHVPDGESVTVAAREAVGALGRVEDLLCRAGLLDEGDVRRAFPAARECAERFAGLALACADSDPVEKPTERETELCRVAGRAGDDLLLAGRCVRRRNLARLHAHLERAGAEFEREFARVCATVRLLAPRAPSDEARAAALAALAEARAAAAHIFSALGDDEASARVLFPHTEPPGPAGVQPSGDAQRGGQPCTTQAARTAFAGRRSSAAATTCTRG